MRKVLLILFALLIVVAMTSCEPKVHHTPVPEIELDMHDAPFSKANAQYGTLRNYKSLSTQPEILKFHDYQGKDMYESTSTDGNFLYILRTVGDGEATLETYPRCTTESHNSGECGDNCYAYTVKYTSTTYYSLTPVMAYYFRFERDKYGFSTKDYELGEAIQIKECWNIGPNRKEREDVSWYLSGFVFFTRTSTYYADYAANVGVFCYRCKEAAGYDDGRIDITWPSYIYNQVVNKYDSFNSDGEKNEGWDTKISVLSGYASKGWREVAGGFDYPESLAHYKDDMTKMQGLDGTWHEVIVTKSEN